MICRVEGDMHSSGGILWLNAGSGERSLPLTRESRLAGRY